MAKAVLQRNGFAGTLLDKMLGTWYFECFDPDTGLHYIDAVGDLGSINDEWMASVGPGQVRCLKDPSSGNFADTFRVVSVIHDDADANAKACRAICGPNGELMNLWTVHRTGKYLEKLGVDFPLYRGHKYRKYWDSQVPVLNPVKDPQPVQVFE